MCGGLRGQLNSGFGILELFGGGLRDWLARGSVLFYYVKCRVLAGHSGPVVGLLDVAQVVLVLSR